MKRRPPVENPCFRYLRKLKADGRSNMYGAVPYLMKAFGIEREAAFAIICEWLDQQAASAGSESAAARRPVGKLSA